jgi:hypothetical protein
MHHNFWNEPAIAIRKEMEHGKGYLRLMNFLLSCQTSDQSRVAA